jgi:uncharacterized protein (DUF1501 family)
VTSCTDFLKAASLSRRGFLQGMAAAGGTAIATSVIGDAVTQTVFAAEGTGNVMVVLSLRGGVDGLGLVVPHAEPAYYAARPTIAVPAGALLQKDPVFGMHPDLEPVEWLFSSGQLAFVHAVGTPVPDRSHFTAMETVEDADPTSPLRRGWVNRLIGIDTDATPLEAVHLGSVMEPTLVTGPAPTVAAYQLSDIALTGAEPNSGPWGDRRTRQLRTAWRHAPGPLGSAGRSTLETVEKVKPLVGKRYAPADGVVYPSSSLGRSLSGTAQLIKADLGTEVVSIDYGSWDTHTNYGTVADGDMQALVRGLATALDAFMRDLGELRSKVTVVTVSEFGRRVAENGSAGLDHGWGNVMLVAGGGVRGGAYYGSWPGLDSTKLTDGDLKVTTDYRTVLGEIVSKRFNRSASTVFPGVTGPSLGVLA